MKNFQIINRIKSLYINKGQNIIKALRKAETRKDNTIEDILISYDIQAGSYTKQYLHNKAFKELYDQRAVRFAEVLNKYSDINSILDVGIGEATNMRGILQNISRVPEYVLGMDISWSRLKFAKNFLTNKNIGVKLFTADLFEIPLLDNSVDLVYTQGAIEPNGGRETEALTELYRVTNKYLVLIEPDFENASNEARERMKQHGYVQGFHNKALELGYNVVEYRPWFSDTTCYSLIVIKKEPNKSNHPVLVCPVTHSALENHNDSLLYSKDSMLAYPVIDEIPCLLKSNAVLAVHLETDYSEFIK